MNKNHQIMSAIMILFSCAAPAAQDTQLVGTPFGLRPKQCIHTHPSGTTIHETSIGIEAEYPDGSVKKYPIDPKCVAYQKRWLLESGRLKHFDKNSMNMADGWLDNAYWLPHVSAQMLSGNYHVPNDPSAGQQYYWLYYFLGLENLQSGELSILQPVLSWSSEGWQFTSWNCCPQGQLHNAAPVAATAASVVHGQVQQQGDTWVIDSISAGEHSTLKVDANGRIFNYVDATLETYGVVDCTYFPPNPFYFTEILVVLRNGQTTSPTWQTTGATECSGATIVNSPSSIAISHN